MHIRLHLILPHRYWNFRNRMH